ncbi:hypothetical protein C5167_004300 [Papaver somniferum]|nr:hypothetical protein C5167_004300 [Papaver somniferum]
MCLILFLSTQKSEGISMLLSGKPLKQVPFRLPPCEHSQLHLMDRNQNSLPLFVDERLEMPEDIDIQWESIIKTCLHRCVFCGMLLYEPM